MRKSIPFARLASLVVPLALATAAHAQYVGGLAVTTVADANPDRQDTDSWNLLSNTPATWNTPVSHTVSASLGGGMNGTSTISGQMGILKAASFAEYPAIPSGKSAQAHTQVNALDYLTVVAPGLARGTPVTLRFLYHLSGTFSTPVFEFGGSYAASATGYLQATTQSGAGGFTKRYENLNGAAPYDLVGTMDALVSERVGLAYGLDTFAYVGGTATVARQASVDFSNTAIAYAWSDDPGVTLVAASGHDYAPVPEPASFAALALGALPLLRRKRA